MRIPEPVRGWLVAAVNRWHAFRASREVSVKTVAAANTREAFDRLYGSPELLGEYLGAERLAFYRQVAELCVEFSPRSIVDVGCGSGHLLRALADRLSDIGVMVGVDEAPQAIARLREVVPEAIGVIASVYDVEVDPEAFDLVVCTEVLEHLDRPDAALDVLRRLCAPGGRIVATVPDGDIDDFEGHVNFWNVSEFERLLSRVGPASVSRLDDTTFVGIVSAR